MRGYFLSTRAHNTVEVDRRDFSRKTPDAYGSGIRQVAPYGEVWVIDAKAPHPQNGCEHHRKVLFLPGRFLLAVDHVVPTDKSIPFKARLFTNWWHFNPELKLSKSASPNIWQISGLTGGCQVHVSHATSAKGLRGTYHRGEIVPRPQGWISRAYLKHEPAPTLGFSAKTDTDYFAATLFEITRDGAAPELSLDWRASANSIALTNRSGGRPAFQLFRFGAFKLETDHAFL